MRQTKALASAIFFVFSVILFSFNTLNTKEENLTMGIASVVIFLYGYGPDLRVSVNKHRRNRGHSSKFDLANTLHVGRLKYHTYQNDTLLLKYSFVCEK